MLETLTTINRGSRLAFPPIAIGTATVAVPSTITLTTGGTTLAAQVAEAGASWRVRAMGTLTTVSSATVRSAIIAPFWGTTQLPSVTSALLISSVQTAPWEVEFILSTTSATALRNAGRLFGRMTSATLFTTVLPTIASTTVVAGPLAIDLRFRMSAVVAGDSWSVHSVVIERIS